MLLNRALVGMLQERTAFFVAISLVLNQRVLTASVTLLIEADGRCINLQFFLLLLQRDLESLQLR